MNVVCTRLPLLTFISMLLFSGSHQEKSCVSPQYLELGRTGIINCTFQKNLFSLLWYDTVDYSNNDPILQLYQNGIKSGVGYESGEYDVYRNGSLSINRVSTQSNRSFTVAYVPTEEAGPSFITIRVIVTYENIMRCPSPQTGYVGHFAIIKCQMGINFERISWYDEALDIPVATYSRKTKEDSISTENDNGDYSIFIDGSLFIYNVEHERSNVRYTVEVVDNNTIGKLSQTVDFIVMREPLTTFSTTTVPVSYTTAPVKYTTAPSEPDPQSITYQGRFEMYVSITNFLILLLTTATTTLILVSICLRKKCSPPKFQYAEPCCANA